MELETASFYVHCLGAVLSAISASSSSLPECRSSRRRPHLLPIIITHIGGRRRLAYIHLHCPWRRRIPLHSIAIANLVIAGFARQFPIEVAFRANNPPADCRFGSRCHLRLLPLRLVARYFR